MIAADDTELEALFEKHSDEFLNFDKIQKKRNQRPDMHAFLLLDDIIPGEKKGDMVRNAEHDEIWIDVKWEDFVKHATEDNVIELVRCGVRFSDSYFCLFV